jgi:arylsulfatase A-like enzyme
VLPTIADITGAKLPKVKLDGRSFWPQCQGKKGNPRKFIFQYYYPKYKPAADKHGQGVNKQEIIWAQNQRHKLYRDGTLYRVLDRYEKTPLKAGGNAQADRDRKILQEALDSMPAKAAKLRPNKKKKGS